MASIGSFTAEFLADVSGFVQGIKNAGSALDNFLGEITAGILQAHLIEDATKAAFRAIGDAVEAAVVETAKYGDEILAMSQKTGVATETLGGLVFAFKQGNASQEDLSTGLRILSKNLEAASEGSKKQAAAFAFLDVAAKDSAGQLRPLNDVMLDVADRFATMPDGAEKSALAIAVFGKAGDKLIPTLNEGSKGIREQTELAKKYGAVMSGEAAEAGDRFNDALGETQLALQGLNFAIGEQIIPKLTALITLLNDYIATTPGITRSTMALAEIVLRTTIPAFGDFMAALDKVTAEQKKAADSAFEYHERLKALAGSAKSFAQTQEEAAAAAKAHKEALKTIAEAIKDNQHDLLKFAEDVQTQISRNIDLMTDNWLKGQKKIEDAQKSIADIIRKNQGELIREQEDFDKRNSARIEANTKVFLDANDLRIKDAEDALKKIDKTNEDLAKSFAVALGNITSDFAKAFTDVIFEGKSFSESMQNLFKTTAKSLFSAFLTGLFQPLTKQLQDAGREFASFLTGSGGGGGGAGGAGGLLGGLGGGGGLLGGLKHLLGLGPGGGGFLNLLGGGGGFAAALGPFAALFGGSFAGTTALLNLFGGGPKQFPTSEFVGPTTSSSFGGIGGTVGSPQTYGPDSPAYLAAQRPIIVNVAGNLLGITDLARTLAKEINNLTRDESMVAVSSR